jgi:hypothetical protein
MPAFYYDVMDLTCLFLAPALKVKAILPSKRMHPYRLTPWHSVISISAVSYRDSDIGAYNEVVIAVPITLDDPSPLLTGLVRPLPPVPMTYIHQMPVTTEIARDAGIEFLGTPKFLANIEIEEREDRVHCHLFEGTEHIFTLAGRIGTLKPSARSRIDLITRRKGYLLRWEWVLSEQSQSVSRNASDVSLELGSHPVSQELRDMSLGRALSCQYTPHFQGILTPVLESYPA